MAFNFRSKSKDAAPDIAAQVASGTYFSNAKQWYKLQFVAPIAHRSWMLLIAGVSVVCALFSIFSLFGLLPINEKPAIPTYINDIDDFVIRGERIRESGEDSVSAVLEFYVAEYVKRRENYQYNRYEGFSNFVVAHSEDSVASQYLEIFGEQNPRSLKNVLSDQGTRVISITGQKIHYNGVKAIANLTFNARFYAENMDIPESNWKVSLEAIYRPIQIAEEIDVIGSDVMLDIKPANFKVTKYEVFQID